MRHLELIQGVISRMAKCSFALKGWAVTLVAALFALASKESNHTYFYISYVPIIIFWFLDAYYLYQERLYRALYEKARHMKNEDIDFDLNANCDEFKVGKNKYFCCVFSKTELWFYFPVALLCLILVILPACYK